MQMDRIAEKMFEAYASASKSRYLFMRNMKTKHSRWSTNAVDFFGLPGEYMDDAYHTFLEHIHPEDKEQFQAEWPEYTPVCRTVMIWSIVPEVKTEAM